MHPDPTSSSLGVRPKLVLSRPAAQSPTAIALHIQQDAERELLRTLAVPGDYATRAAWRRDVRAALRDLRQARRAYHAAWTGFCAGRRVSLPLAAE